MSNTASLADQYAALKIQIEALETELKVLKNEIVATGQEIVLGEKFQVKVSLQERTTISTTEIGRAHV